MSDSDKPISFMPSDGLSYDPDEARYWDPPALQTEITRAFDDPQSIDRTDRILEIASVTAVAVRPECFACESTRPVVRTLSEIRDRKKGETVRVGISAIADRVCAELDLRRKECAP